MVEGSTSSPTAARRRRKSVNWTVAGLLALLFLYILWMAALYQGWFLRVSEWQFGAFGEWRPSSTVLVFFLVPAVLVLLIIWFARRRASGDTHAEVVADEVTTWRTRSDRFRRFADWAAVVFAVAALLTLASGLLLENQGRPVRFANAPTAATAGTPEAEVVAGTPDSRLKATMAFNLLFTHRDVQYAPVFDAAAPRTIRYVVEVPDVRDVDGQVADTGDFRLYEGKVPGPLLVLYRTLGYRIHPQVHLIERSRTTILWPFFTAATQLAAGALIAFLLARWQGRRVRRIDRDLAPAT